MILNPNKLSLSQLNDLWFKQKWFLIMTPSNDIWFKQIILPNQMVFNLNKSSLSNQMVFDPNGLSLSNQMVFDLNGLSLSNQMGFDLTDHPCPIKWVLI
jgi:hypothetical protein